MVRVFFVCSFLLGSFFCFSQRTFENGPFSKFYDDGTLKEEGTYSNDKKVGVWKRYYKSGELHWLKLYNQKGDDTGVSKVFYKTGILKIETTNSKRGQLVTKEYFENEKLFCIYYLEISNKSFRVNGQYKEYYSDGNLKIETSFSKNAVDGQWKSFYKSGVKEWEVSYSEGKRIGPYVKYAENGSILLKGQNVDGKQSGEEIRYLDSGVLLSNGTYEKGLLSGEWYLYDKKGNELCVLKYKKGKLKKKVEGFSVAISKVPFWALEETAVYPGCEELSDIEKKKCFSENLDKLLAKKFDTNIAVELGLNGVQRVYVTFKVNNKGEVVNIQAKARHPRLQQEAIRVCKLLPSMTPGKQHGKNVTMTFTKPITFRVAAPKTNSPF